MNRRVVSLLSLICFVPIFVFSLTPVGSHAAAGASPARSIVVDVDLPSDSTGVPEGTLAVRIFAPASDDRARYAEGAPVVIFVPGGSDAGSLRPPLSKADDMIRIVFLFPGGTDPVAGRSSDGTYDYRGPDSIAALRDVIRYAAGDLTDSRGRTIDDVVPMPVLHDNIGLVGSSNGGNIVVAVAAKHGGDLAGHLRYIVQWESPVSSQIATVDLGGVRLDCPGGRRAALFTVNPRYGGYGLLMLNVDYRQIAYDPRSPRHPIFLDGNGDGRYTTVVDPSNGCRTPDLDLNGTLEMDEDFPLAGYTDGAKWYYSRPVTQALVDYGVFRGGWPTNIATPAEVSAFWDLREAVRLYSAALTHIPDLEGMVLASVVDHVQAAPDHPHIRQAFEGWDRAGAWVKINPARRYVVAVDSSLSGRTDLPDNAANVAPADWSDTALYAYPDGLEDAYFAAAVHEMADRARSAGATPTPTATATPTPTPTPSPPPAAPVRRSTVSLNALYGWTAEMGNHLKIFDVAVDEARNRIYVQGILTSGIAVIDGEADTLVASLDSGMDETGSHRTYLAVHPTRGILYVADWHQRTLRAVDPQTGVITGPITLPGDPFQMVVDAGAERLYVSMRASGKVAVYDAETLALVRVIDLGANRIGGMVLDREGRRLYVVDSDDPGAAQRSRLYVIDTRALAALQPISFRNPFGRPADFVDRDPATGRFFVTTGARLFILSARGAVERAVVLPEGAREPIYWADTGKVYVLSREGISPIRSALSVVDANTGRLEAKVDLGTGGAQHLALNRLTGKLYTPGMEYSEVVVVDARTYRVLGKVDVGNSVEDVAVAPSDGTIYLANRLGGSTVIAYRPDTSAWSEFEAGGWPTAVDVDPGLNRLYVLSHYDGMVFAYDLSSDPLNPTLLGSVRLGLADTRDTISNQIVDATHHRVITTHPEHDRIVIVDGERLEVVATIRDVPSFDAKADLHGRGHLQPAVDEGLDKLYVLSARARKVDVFDGDRGYAYLRTIDLSGYSWSWDRDFNDFLLWVDSGRHRLYVGPLIIDTLTDTYIGQLPADGGQVVVGLDAASDLLYTIGVAFASSERPSAGASWSSVDARRPTCQPRCAASDEQPRVFRLYILDRDTYAVKDRIDLRALTYVPPYVALDAARARFYAGYMQTAEVDIYTLGGTEPSPSPTPTPGAPCRVYLPQTSTDPSETLAVALVIGDPQPESPIRPLLGVNAGPVPSGAPGNADLTAAYQDIGVTMVRTHDFYGPLDMSVIYPDRTKDPSDPGSYRFTESDAIFRAILEGGFEPYLRLGDSWNNVAPPSTPMERANWARAAVEVVRHYTEGKWDGFTADVRYVEIWNEPDHPRFWPAPRTRQEFLQLFEETARALKAAFPDLQVGGPGFAPSGAKVPRGQQFVREFLQYMRDRNVPIDFLSWHMYANEPQDFAEAAAFYRDLLDEMGYAEAESHITEWNTSVREVGRQEAVALRAGAKGAALMTAAWIGLQDQGVDVATFYRGGDTGPDMAAGYGLFYADGRPKRMALAFSLWSEMADHPERLAVRVVPVGDAGAGDLWVLAGRDDEGEIAVLVANPGDAAVSWCLAFADGRAVADDAVAVREVSDENDAVRTFTPMRGAAVIGADAVQLILIADDEG